MREKFLYWAERVLDTVIIIASSLGLFFVIMLTAYYIAGDAVMILSWELAILFASILITLGLNRVYLNVRYELLEIEAIELEQERALRNSGISLGEADELYEHLRIRL